MSREPSSTASVPAAPLPGEPVHESVLDAVGNTPLVRLTRVTAGLAPRIYAKLEQTNPGGSVKDRAALEMVLSAERSGALRPGGTIVEATSGNTGVGLALVAAHRGYRALLVVPDKTSPDKIAVLRAYGAEVVVTPGGLPREHPQHVHTLAVRLAAELPGAWLADQYDNPANPGAHHAGTGPQIWRQTGGRITHLVAGIGTGGTVTGIARYLREVAGGRVTVVGADPRSSTYSGGDGSPYAVEAIGHYRHPDTVDDGWPGSYDPGLVDRVLGVGDRDSMLTARRLAREEGLLVGPSSGTAVAAALALARELGPDDLVVVVLPDSGRGYLSTALDDDWLRARGFLEEPLRAGSGPLVRAAADAAHGSTWPALATVADDVPAAEVAAAASGVGRAGGAPDEEVVVVLHGRSGGDPDLVGPAAPEVLGVVRPAGVAEALRTGRLRPDAPIGAAPLVPVVTAGAGEPVTTVLARLVPGGPEVVPVLVDGRAATALTRTQLERATRTAPDRTPTDVPADAPTDVPTDAPTNREETAMSVIDPRAEALSEIFSTTESAVAADAGASGVVFRAAGRGEAGVFTRITAGRHVIGVDEPPVLGGQDAAANPVETALAALISCQVVTYRFWAARLGVALEDVEVSAEGDLDVRGFFGLDDAVRPGFTGVRFQVTLRGPESPERYAELQRAVDAHCPVLDLFSNPTPVQTALVTEQTAGVPA